MEEYFSVNQAAEKMGMCTKQVYKLLRSGQLVGRKVSPKMWRVPASQITVFMHPSVIITKDKGHKCKPPIIGVQRLGDAWMCPYCNRYWNLVRDEGSQDDGAYWSMV